jgi:hypothetical protein
VTRALISRSRSLFCALAPWDRYACRGASSLAAGTNRRIPIVSADPFWAMAPWADADRHMMSSSMPTLPRARWSSFDESQPYLPRRPRTMEGKRSGACSAAQLPSIPVSHLPSMAEHEMPPRTLPGGERLEPLRKSSSMATFGTREVPSKVNLGASKTKSSLGMNQTLSASTKSSDWMRAMRPPNIPVRAQQPPSTADFNRELERLTRPRHAEVTRLRFKVQVQVRFRFRFRLTKEGGTGGTWI